MGTTELFVELIVIGVGAFIWINALVGFVTFFSSLSWYQLMDTQYRRLKDDAKFLRQSQSKKRGN